MAQHDTFIATGAQEAIKKTIAAQKARVQDQINKVRGQVPVLTTHGLTGDGHALRNALEEIGRRGDRIIAEFERIESALLRAANVNAASVEQMRAKAQELTATIEDFRHITTAPRG